MPLSNPLHIPCILHFAFAVQPKRIFDVGVGIGAYGFVLRQYSDFGEGTKQRLIDVFSMPPHSRLWQSQESLASLLAMFAAGTVVFHRSCRKSLNPVPCAGQSFGRV